MTKVDIISGFLGSGKTTLIRKLLEEGYKEEKMVLVENEFGEVGVDGGFLKDAGIEISELNSGCICCTLVGDFDRNLRDICAQYSPDRIIIEPSGVAKLSDIMASVVALKEELGLEINALATVINTARADKQLRSFGEFFKNQIEYATAVILSRTQNLDEAKVNEVVSSVKEINPKAAVITTPWDELTGEQLLKVMEGRDTLALEMDAVKEAAEHALEHEHEHHHHDHDEHEHHHHDHDEHEHHHHDHDHDEHEHHHHDHDHDEHEHHHHDHDHDHDHEHHHHDHHADEIFDTWGIETPHKFSREIIEAAMKNFDETEVCGTVVRAKGMVPAEDGEWIYFDFVDGEYELKSGDPDYTGRLCVIGVDLKADKIEEAFGLTK